jgi:hypothetical protein
MKANAVVVLRNGANRTRLPFQASSRKPIIVDPLTTTPPIFNSLFVFATLY